MSPLAGMLRKYRFAGSNAACVNLAGYIAHHAAGQQYSGYWPPSEAQQADQQVAKP
jgi:hypothetical protein